MWPTGYVLRVNQWLGDAFRGKDTVSSGPSGESGQSGSDEERQSLQSAESSDQSTDFPDPVQDGVRPVGLQNPNHGIRPVGLQDPNHRVGPAGSQDPHRVRPGGPQDPNHRVGPVAPQDPNHRVGPVAPQDPNHRSPCLFHSYHESGCLKGDRCEYSHLVHADRMRARIPRPRRSVAKKRIKRRVEQLLNTRDLYSVHDQLQQEALLDFDAKDSRRKFLGIPFC
eukprot:s5297_g1.t1